MSSFINVVYNQNLISVFRYPPTCYYMFDELLSQSDGLEERY